MAVSIALSRVLQNSFQSTNSGIGISARRSFINYDNNNVYNVSLKVDLSRPEIIIPMTLRGIMNNILRTEYNGVEDGIKSLDEIKSLQFIYPLINIMPTENKRTFNSIFRTLLSFNYNSRLVKVKTSKGEIYHGAPGIVLDEEYNVLLLMATKATLEEHNLLYYEPVLYINPSVFINKDLVSKNIISNIVPYFIENKVILNDSSINYEHIKYKDGLVSSTRFMAQPRLKVGIEIKDMTSICISLPETPTVNSINKNNINSFLIKESNTLMDILL